eukprot:jgi/Tetstr1/438437/TSEL_026994.t1
MFRAEVAIVGMMYVFYARGKASVGAATAAYAIGVVLQKVEPFGVRAELSSVVLDYINPTALPCAASWQLLGWLTRPLGGEEERLGSGRSRLPGASRGAARAGRASREWHKQVEVAPV